MTYGALHRFFLRTTASRGVLTFEEAKQVLENFSDAGKEESIQDIVKDINDEIRPFQQTIKITRDELTDEEVIVFLSLGYDDATKSQTIFSATELEYFRILIEEIMTTDSRQITGIHSMNLVGKMKASFTKTDAQRLLNIWCRMKYLDKDQTNYALGVRAIHEFESYLRQNMPDTIEECCLCKQIVFRGYNCGACGKAVHNRCLTRYLEMVEKWPCCKADYSADQLEQLNSQSSRLTQPHQEGTSGENTTEEPEALEPTQELSDEMECTQDVIPEISQRVTRKRKRT